MTAKNVRLAFFLLSILFIFLTSCLPGPVPESWQILYDAPGSPSFRGIGAVDESICWVSGSQGTILKTTDGGQTWQDMSVPDADTLDFRDIHAFDENTAVAMSIGSGEYSQLYRTDDGGSTWELAYVNRHETGFYDAIDFWDDNFGILQGDPINGKLFILVTEDGGRSWQEIDSEAMPDVADGEYAFAASGSHLITTEGGHAWIGTGGVQSRILHSGDYGHSWNSIPSPIIQGEPSTGIFSLVFEDNNQYAIAVGGDYEKEQEGTDNIIYSDDGGTNWHLLPDSDIHFRSSVQYTNGIFLAVGPSGSEYSSDRGSTWTPISGPGFHTMSIGKDGLFSVWAAGASGRIAKLTVVSEP